MGSLSLECHLEKKNGKEEVEELEEEEAEAQNETPTQTFGVAQ